MEIRDIWERPVWAIKQLLPLKYTTTYTCRGRRERQTWRMWFGRCFAITTEAA